MSLCRIIPRTMRKLILVIDDDRVTRMLTYHFLKSANFKILLADDGFSGLRLAKELQPDLILCNIIMPGLDGYDVLKEIRKDLTTAKIPFIFITAKTNLSSCYRALQLGASDWLAKPVDKTDLLKAIAIQINKR